MYLRLFFFRGVIMTQQEIENAFAEAIRSGALYLSLTYSSKGEDELDLTNIFAAYLIPFLEEHPNQLSSIRIAAPLWKILDQQYVEKFFSAIGPSTTSLNLSRTSLSDQRHATIVANFLKKNKTLTRLVLDDNHLDDDTAPIIANALTENTSLKELEWSSSYHNSDIGPNTSKAIANALQWNSSLERLKIVNHPAIGTYGMQLLLRALEWNKGVKQLYFSGNTSLNNMEPWISSPEAQKTLISILEKNETLKELYLWEPLDPNMLEVFVTLLKENKTKISELRINVGNFSSGKGLEDLERLFDALSSNKTIRFLSLWGIDHLDNIPRLLAKALNKNGTLVLFEGHSLDEVTNKLLERNEQRATVEDYLRQGKHYLTQDQLQMALGGETFAEMMQSMDLETSEEKEIRERAAKKMTPQQASPDIIVAIGALIEEYTEDMLQERSLPDEDALQARIHDIFKNAEDEGRNFDRQAAKAHIEEKLNIFEESFPRRKITSQIKKICFREIDEYNRYTEEKILACIHCLSEMLEAGIDMSAINDELNVRMLNIRVHNDKNIQSWSGKTKTIEDALYAFETQSKQPELAKELIESLKFRIGIINDEMQKLKKSEPARKDNGLEQEEKLAELSRHSKQAQGNNDTVPDMKVSAALLMSQQSAGQSNLSKTEVPKKTRQAEIADTENELRAILAEEEALQRRKEAAQEKLGKLRKTPPPPPPPKPV